MVNGPPTSRLRAVIWTLSGDMEYFARELSISIEIFIELALLMVRMRPRWHPFQRLPSYCCLEINPSDSGHVERKQPMPAPCDENPWRDL